MARWIRSTGMSEVGLVIGSESDGDVHLDSAGATQDTGQHGHPLLGEGVRWEGRRGGRLPEPMHSGVAVAVAAESFAHCGGQSNTIPRAAVTRITLYYPRGGLHLTSSSHFGWAGRFGVHPLGCSRPRMIIRHPSHLSHSSHSENCWHLTVTTQQFSLWPCHPPPGEGTRPTSPAKPPARRPGALTRRPPLVHNENCCR